jgi:hypothetical protein
MKSFLLWLAAMLGMLSLVPLSAWLATGRWSACVQCAKEYGVVLLILFVIPIVCGGLLALFFIAIGVDPT